MSDLNRSADSDTLHGSRPTWSGPPPADEELDLERRIAAAAPWRRLGMGVALFIALLAPASAARYGPPEGSDAWVDGQTLLVRPGPALAAARAAREQGDRMRAEWLLAEISVRHPVIGDYADHMRAELLLELERGVEAGEVATAALAGHPNSPLRAQLHGVRGHALAAEQKEVEARAAWRAALDASRDKGLRAGWLLATARSQERSGDPAGAIETYRVLWLKYPLSVDARRAGERLDTFEAQRGRVLRTAVDWRRRADTLYRSRRNPEALEAYEKALAMGLSKSEDARAKGQRAHVLFRMREYPRAVEAFGKLPQKDDVPIWYARSLARADRVWESIDLFEAMGRDRHSPNALRARFLAALLLDGRGRTEEARRYFKSLSGAGAPASTRKASLWRLGWGAYREKRYADAIEFIEQLTGYESDPIDGIRIRYWRARALEQLSGQGGNAIAAASAQREFEAIALEFPLTYYGWRARLRLPPGQESRPDAPKPDELLTGGRRKLRPGDLTRVRILVEAGMEDGALAELSRVSKRVGGLADRLELAQLFRDAGHYRSAQRMVVDPYKLALTRGPSATYEDLWWHAWPAAYIDLVEEATSAPGSVEPALVFSIMREESGFRPEVMSPVGARGLLQIMETTGRQLAERVGHPDFRADDLFEPRTNIRLGSHYLRELSTQFDGRLSAAIASYNAGPEAVSRWLEARGELEDDEWVEAIPYDQTRSYVKRVLRSLQAYSLLY